MQATQHFTDSPSNVSNIPQRLIKFTSLNSILDFPSDDKPKKKPARKPNPNHYSENTHNPCPNCGGSVDETTNYLTCMQCGYAVKK